MLHQEEKFCTVVGLVNCIAHQLEKKNGRSFNEIVAEIPFWKDCSKKFKQRVWYCVRIEPLFRFSSPYSKYKHSPIWLREEYIGHLTTKFFTRYKRRWEGEVW